MCSVAKNRLMTFESLAPVLEVRFFETDSCTSQVCLRFRADLPAKSNMDI